jgi:hypothetical protein
MQAVGVEHAVKTGAAHVDLSRDLRAGQHDCALEGYAIDQGQIALGMQTLGGEGAIYHRAIERDGAVCPRVAQLDRTFDPAAGDLDRPDELRVFKIDISHNPGARDRNSLKRHRLPPRRPRQQVLQKAGRELAAIVLPFRILLLLGIKWGLRAATFVEIGHLALLDLRPGPALGGLHVVVGATRRGKLQRPQAQPNRQRTQNRQRMSRQ